MLITSRYAGPTVLCLALLAAIVINFILRVRSTLTFLLAHFTHSLRPYSLPKHDRLSPILYYFLEGARRGSSFAGRCSAGFCININWERGGASQGWKEGLC